MHINPYQTPQVASTPPSLPPYPSKWVRLKALLFSFQERIPRGTFWLSTLCIYFIAAVGIGILMNGVEGHTGWAASLGPIMLTVLACLFLWMTLALRVKRWHDRDKSGMWVLIALVPIIGPLWSFIEIGCLPGTEGHNRFGADPLS